MKFKCFHKIISIFLLLETFQLLHLLNKKSMPSTKGNIERKIYMESLYQ